MFNVIYNLVSLINKAVSKGELLLRDYNEVGLKIAFVYRGIVVAEKTFDTAEEAIEFLNNTGNQTEEGLLFRMRPEPQHDA